MNRITFETWRSRMAAAEAALTAAPGSTSDKAIRRALTAATAALKQALERLETVSRDLEDAARSSRLWRDRHDCVLSSLPFSFVMTSPTGEISAANAAGGGLLNTSPGHLVGKSILLYLEERESWILALRELRSVGQTVRAAVCVRPRERARRPMLASVTRIDGDTLWWVFLPPQCAESGEGSELTL